MRDFFRDISLRRRFAAAALFFSAVAGGSYLHIYSAHRSSLLADTEDLLASVAKVKADEIANWRKEREADILSLANNPLMVGEMEAVLGAVSPERKKRLTVSLKAFMNATDRAAADLYSYSGKRILSAVDTHPEESAEMEAVRKALKTGAVYFGEPYYCERHAGVHLSLAAPLRRGARVLGYLLLRYDPATYLYPLIQTWPGASPTAETLLVRESGGEILFLNDLRHRPASAVRFRLPLDSGVAAASALAGREGFFPSRDYRGKAIYAYALRVQDSAWYLVAKVDSDEVEAKAAARLRLSLGLTTALLALLLLAVYEFSRRRAEAVEKEKQRLLEALADSGDTLVVFDLQTRELVEFGGAFEGMYGYNQREFAALKAEDLAAPEGREAMRRRFGQIAAGDGQNLIYETEHLRKDGSVLPVEVSARRIEVGDRLCLHGVLRDVSARRRLRERDRLEKLRLEALARLSGFRADDEAALLDAALEEGLRLTASPIGYIYSYSEERRLFTLNSWSREVMKSCVMTEKQTVYELDKTGIWGEVVRQRKGLLVNDYSAPHPLKKGCPEGHSPLTRWLSVPVFSGGRIVAVMGVANKKGLYTEDELALAGRYMEGVWGMVEARRAAALLREAEKRLETTVSNLSGAVYRCLDDEDWTMEYLSPGVGELTGYRPEEFLSGNVAYASLVLDEDRPALREKIAAAMAAGGFFEHVYRLRRADGSFRWVWEHGRPAHGAGPRRIDGYITDITELKLLELERERLNTELAAKNKELEEFLYVTTHDLRSPLINIQGFSQNLSDHARVLHGHVESCGWSGAEVKDLVAAKMPEALKYITESAAKMDRLISALLRLSRAGRAPARPERLEMNALLDQVFGLFSFRAGSEGAELRRGELPSCLADREMLNQVFSNLVENSFKYAAPGRPLRLEVSGRVEGRTAVYEVRDNGRGIAPEQIDKIWKIFYRAEVDRSVPGEGLGLALVKGLLERNGGRAYASSEPGKGAVFSVELPAG